MGCGASTAVHSSTLTSNTAAAAVPPAKSILVNGTSPGRAPRRKNNADAKHSLSVSTDSIESVDSVNAKQFKRQLSSIDEHACEHAVAVQTDFESVFGIKSQYVQTDIELNPEDELELMMNETNAESDDESGSHGSPNGRNSTTGDDEYTRSSCDVVSRKAHKQYFSIGIQATRCRSCSTQTRSFGFLQSTSTTSQKRLSANKFAMDRGKKRRDTQQRLWTAPSKPEDIEKVSPKQHDFESQTDPISQALAANAADSSDLNVLHSYDISSPFSHIEKELAASNDSSKKGKRNFDIRLQECLNKLLDDMEDSLGGQRSGELLL